VILSNADCAFMKFGNSAVHHLDTRTARLSVLAGGQVDGPRLGIPRQGGATHFTQRFALQGCARFQAAQAMRFALEHQNPLVTGLVAGGDALPAESFSLLKVSHPDVLLWALKPAEEGVAQGIVARVWNLSPEAQQFSLSLATGLTAARQTTHIETDIAPASIVNGSLSASARPSQLLTFRLTPGTQVRSVPVRASRSTGIPPMIQDHGQDARATHGRDAHATETPDSVARNEAPAWFSKAPPLAPPRGEVLRVATAEELLAAVERLGPGGTILLADGHYRVPRVIVLQEKKNVTIRSAAGDPARVVLRGKGWDSQGRGDDILHIGRCEGVTIADLTFTDCRSYGIKVEAENAPRDIHIYNCRFQDIGVRAIKGSAGQDPNVRAVGGSVRYCRFENTKVPPADWLYGGNYIAAIDMMALEDWTFSDNVFRDIKGRTGGGRAAIFLWVRSRGVTVERNLIVNCDRGIAFGNPGQSTANRAGEQLVYVRDGIIRNNFIAGGPDCGIELWYADCIQVYHNSIWRPERNWNRGIRIGTGTAHTDIANNLVHGEIRLEGGEAQLRQNLAGRLDGYFVDPVSGNLALTPAAAKALDQGVSLPEVTDDIRGRPRRGLPDLGAWEAGGAVRKFGVYEVVLHGDGAVDNPFDTLATVSFTPPSGQAAAKTVYAFYDGGDIWRATVYVSEPGVWKWFSSCGTDKGLDGQSGTFQAQDSPLRGRLLTHSKNPRQWMTEDGRWFLNLNDTAYCLLCTHDAGGNPIPFEDFTAYVRDAAAQGITSFRSFAVCGPKGFGASQAGMWTADIFADSGFTRLRPERFQETDRTRRTCGTSSSGASSCRTSSRIIVWRAIRTARAGCEHPSSCGGAPRSTWSIIRMPPRRAERPGSIGTRHRVCSWT
jgi:hypothetical protein